MFEELDLHVAEKVTEPKREGEGIWSIAICSFPTWSCFGGCHQPL